MGDVFDSIAEQGFQPNQPYPDGRFDCDLEYSFPTGELVGFGLVLGMATGCRYFS